MYAIRSYYGFIFSENDGIYHKTGGRTAIITQVERKVIMNKRFGYILGGMGALAACVLLILAGARVWLGTDTAQRLVQEKISNAIPGTVEWKDLDFSVFAGKAELHGLLLKVV